MSAEQFPAFEDIPQQNPEGPQEAGGFSRDFTLDSTVASLERAGNAVEQTLEALRWPPDDIFAYTLAVREALANIMIHQNLDQHHKDGEDHDDYTDRYLAAMAERGHGKPVAMRIDVRGDEVIVDIQGEGDYVMKIDEEIDPASHERTILPHGRGQQLMFDGCDQLTAYPGGLTLVKRRSDAAAKAPAAFSEEEQA